MCVVRLNWISIAAVLLAGCGGAPDFVYEPPASYRVPLSADIQGVWAREGKDNGERARVSALADGMLRIDFFSTRPDARHIPDTPLIARALRFDNTDWLLVDRNRLSALQHSQYTGSAPYRLIKYALEGDNRLCGIEPSASLFAAAIDAGKLEGKVERYAGPFMHVTVTSPGEGWVKWWSELPASEKMFAQPVFCFQRVD
ncbi:hypothetical protein [Noviherbaspirillum autotrophicum]|uniref:Lipoprotein n=1 Tax=Noviherbaspirillum autotrophicum TaxID=709839 RepID=A0A0C2C1E3_9BURK|nr:hypothetical protein [Noviherbaspirillum autotrophicum]KIF81688.1 hypothetical protein TSA66_14260 [Noviherbaspirillum autotrophicum]KIF82055.1 hypothetical protein TSA66_16625 [Noviherbaspirillum autotrophicum]KIF84151.1 hypothetical protein TSA66_00395 [Noviherbaspirillum autotrophicum]